MHQWSRAINFQNMKSTVNYPITFKTLFTITQSNTEDGQSSMALSVILNYPNNSSCIVYTNGDSNYYYWINMIGI